jgi:hypothetical protein
MTDTCPIYLHQAEDRHLAALKAAKEALDLDVLVKPIVARPGQYSDRVLAFGDHPDWACHSLLVTGPEMASDAILWALKRINLPDDSVVDKLSRWFGAEVKEVTHG